MVCRPDQQGCTRLGAAHAALRGEPARAQVMATYGISDGQHGHDAVVKTRNSRRRTRLEGELESAPDSVVRQDLVDTSVGT